MTKVFVKLNNVDHASQRVVAEFGAQWGDNQMTCMVHTAEMRTLQGTPTPSCFNQQQTLNTRFLWR